MDYENKYIKYKTKYLELKNMNIKNQIGGRNINTHTILLFPDILSNNCNIYN